MLRKKIISIVCVIMAVAMIGIAFSSTVQAEYIDTGEIKVRNISEIKQANTFEEIESLYTSSYFAENGFNWYNMGTLSKEKYTNITDEMDWIGGMTGWQQDMSYSESADMTTYDHRSIALKAGEVTGEGEMGTIGGFIGKNTLAMHKAYPSYVALPDESYWFNQTVKIPMGKWEKETTGIIPEDHWDVRMPSLVSTIITLPNERVEQYLDDPNVYVPAKVLGVALTRTPKTGADIDVQSDFENKNLRLVVFEIESQTSTVSIQYNTSYYIDWMTSVDSWIDINCHFVEAGGKWYLRTIISDSGTQIESPDMILNETIFDTELKLFTSPNNLNMFHCWYSMYTHKHMDMMGFQTWMAQHGWIITLVGILGAIAIMIIGCFLSNPFIVAGGLMVFYTYVGVGATGSSWNLEIGKQLNSAYQFVQDFISQIFGGEPNPEYTFTSYIDRIRISYGNKPPDAYLVGTVMKDTVNVTAPSLVGRTHPLMPYDWFECNGTNSIDSDGTINQTKFFMGVVQKGESNTHSVVTNLTTGVMGLDESGTGSLSLNPKDYATHSSGVSNKVTWEKWEPLKVDMKNMVFDNQDGFDLGYGNPSVFPMMFDGSIVYANGTIVPDWKKLCALISPRNIRTGNIESVAFTGEYSSYRDSYNSDYHDITDGIDELWGITYRWSFGDGSTGTGKTVSHKYVPGIYIVTLTITDKEGNTDVDYASVFIYEEVQRTSEGWYEDMPWWFWYALAGILGAGGLGAVMMYMQPQTTTQATTVKKKQGGKK